ncbi:metallophosphoesterase family protein [Trichococcus shcherbakoviae]|uniref:metallophosphoesterase family protein n=1 Tax=Trichococcus shcherbakoviae TaxID=2094020 RepID=UPI0029F4A4F5|nr:metallophosphoesterase family protein [Trichococcus shcherbakoviae]
MFNRNHRMKVLFATLIIVTAMAGCAKEPYRDSAVEESVATKDAPHTLDVFHIAFAPGADETERTFSWHTRGMNKKGVVELSQLDEEGNVLSSETFEAAGEGILRGFSSHKATITGLEENQLYSYRFGDGHRAWSESYTFRTQATEDDDFNFLFFGDPQIGAGDGAQIDADGWDRTVTTATEMFPDTAFLVSAGDQVNTAHNLKQYDGWFFPEELTFYPIMTLIGNHDYTPFADYFNPPNETGLGADDAGSDFYFTYGNTLFIALNTQRNNIEEHREAMELAVAENPEATHRIVLMHKSIYSSADHARDEDVLAFRDGLVPVFDELDIDVALMGHDHVYVRTYQMKGDAVVEEIAYDEAGAAVDPEGTLYLTGNSASDSKYYDMQDSSVYERYAAVALQLEEPTFMNVEVTDDSLTFTTYKTADQSVVDAYSIVKVDSGE